MYSFGFTCLYLKTSVCVIYNAHVKYVHDSTIGGSCGASTNVATIGDLHVKDSQREKTDLRHGRS